jgi:hypothetical protein
MPDNKMKKSFEEEISAIAKSKINKKRQSVQDADNSSDDNVYVEVLKHLLSISEEAAKIYNTAVNSEVLSVYKLPKEFLEMFLDIPGRRGGFCLISPQKIIVFFDEDPQQITVIGRSRSMDTKQTDYTSKAVQLFKISFSKIGGESEYKDSTGGVIDPYDIVSILVRWITA